MGIQGLIPFLKRSSRFANLKEFKGKCAAVDAYCWLHKGAFSCADKLVKGEPTNGYILYVLKQIDLLVSFGIKPILVFDGCHLPSKAVTEAKRRENREANRRRAKELLRQGNVKEARECFQRCVDITSEMAHSVIQACRERNIDIIVAPYEADAQLAFLDKAGIADLVITEDSDLVIFGCKKVMFKLDSNGGGLLYDKECLHLSMDVARDKFFFEKFRNMCILSGCDYLPSLQGIGLAKSKRFVKACSDPDVFSALKKLPGYINMPNLEVPDEYRHGFMRAINTFEYQMVFDPVSRTPQPLTPYPPGMNSSDFPYCGHQMNENLAFQLALGNVNVQTKQIIDDYHPNIKNPSQEHKFKSSDWKMKPGFLLSHQSIWSGDSFLQCKANMSTQATVPSIARETLKPKTCTVELPHTLKKRKLVHPETELTNDDLMDLYGPVKRVKQEENAQLDEKPVFKNESINNEKHSEEMSDLPLQKSSEKPNARNPFAVKSISNNNATDPSSKQNCFSALKNFSTPKEKIVVRSRYFKKETEGSSPQPKPHSPPKEDSALKDLSNTTFSHEQKSPQLQENTSLCDSSRKFSEICNSSQSSSKYSSSDDPESQFTSSTKSFKWKKLSDMFSYQKSRSGSLTVSGSMICSSSASRNNFIQPNMEIALPETPPTSQNIPLDKREIPVQLDGESHQAENMESVEVESDDPENPLPPSSTPRNPFTVAKHKTQTDSQSKKCLPKIDTHFNEHCKKENSLKASNSSNPCPAKSSCRTPGLSKFGSKKQLSLHDMFSFKK